MGTVTDAAAEHLSKCLQLKDVDFTNCKTLTDAGFEHFGKCTKLQVADFYGCRALTDTAPAFLVHCPHLQKVDFRDTQITIRGIPPALSARCSEVLY